MAWDWWNANNIYGVDFKAGINTQTYKYYIDFAAKYGIPYVILDEGWYKLGNVLEVVPEINMEELTAYASQQNVGIILWVTWKTLDDQLKPALDQFAKWGAKGIFHRGWNAARVRQVILVGGTSFGLGILGAAHVRTHGAALFWISMSIGGLSAASPVGWSIPSLIAPSESVGTLGGIVNFCNHLAGIAAPIVTDYVVKATNSFSAAFGAATIFLLIGIAGYIFLPGRIEPILEPAGRTVIAMNVASANATGCYTHQYLARPRLWLGQISNFQVFVFREQQGLHVKIRCRFARQRDLLSAWLLPCPSSDCPHKPRQNGFVREAQRAPAKAA